MSQDDNIKVLAENITPSSSEEEEKIAKGEKTSDEGTQDIQAQQEQRGKGEMGQIAEPKTVGGTMAQTPREK